MTGRTKRARKPDPRAPRAPPRARPCEGPSTPPSKASLDPLVGFGLATKERLPLEYRDVYRFRPTAKGKKEIGEP